MDVARWSRRGRECKPTACTSLVLLTVILFVSHHTLVARCIVDVQRRNHAVLYRLHRRSSHLVCYCLHGRAGCSYIHRTSTFSITIDLFRFASTSVYYRHDKMRSFVVLCGPLQYLVIPYCTASYALRMVMGKCADLWMRCVQMCRCLRFIGLGFNVRVKVSICSSIHIFLVGHAIW